MANWILFGGYVPTVLHHILKSILLHRFHCVIACRYISSKYMFRYVGAAVVATVVRAGLKPAPTL